MQKLGFTQKQQGKLSAKQVQFVQMLQVPAHHLAARVQQELMSNPSLEEEPSEEQSVAEVAPLGDKVTEFAESRRSYGSGQPLAEELVQRNMGTLELSWYEKCSSSFPCSHWHLGRILLPVTCLAVSLQKVI